MTKRISLPTCRFSIFHFSLFADVCMQIFDFQFPISDFSIGAKKENKRTTNKGVPRSGFARRRKGSQAINI